MKHLRKFLSLNLLLVCVPAAWWLELSGRQGLIVFAAAALAIVPLSAWMGHATEHLATRVGEGLGGLLNATFGNAAELIIAIFALREGQVEVVKGSLIGSVLGNLLLVFGLSMVVGGARRTSQRFNRTAAGAGVSLMVVSVVALVIPAIFHAAIAPRAGVAGGEPAAGVAAAAEPGFRNAERMLSVDIAVVLLAIYGLSLFFSLKTHRHHYSVAEELATTEERVPSQAARHAVWSVKKSIGILLGATVLIAILSEILVKELDRVGEELHLSRAFVGLFLVAIIGNAAEHSTAVLVAAKNRMDLAMGVAIGSSHQIALFVAPLLVLLSYCLPGIFPRSLDFIYTPLEVIAVALSSFIFATVVSDGESNWLEGVLFLAVYTILGMGFFLLPPG